ncbi:MAG TPA: cyclopropane-fatty-acyl-phospholipid synthase family protein [Gammaproteobacteria bacterium]|nr:cyclopropane-fatty-acyl-phospholipid synthase family protein [Gammaproteobacteria bacterium]
MSESDLMEADPFAPRASDAWLRRQVMGTLAGLRHGGLRLHEGKAVTCLGEESGVEAIDVLVNNPRFWWRTVLGGATGVGEAYIDGDWDCSDLVGLMRLLLRNQSLLSGLESGPARLGAWVLRRWHGRNRNSRNGSARNIAAHYDLGNALFRLFLDEDLQYSSAVFTRADQSLESAQREKLERIGRKLDLGPHHHLLEIGTGWGGLAIYMAREYGCRVTTTTLSREQHELASRRVSEAGLADRITLLRSDYRDLEGQYDRIVSVEMVEAVGHEYLDAFFESCASLLKEDGALLLQAITIEDHRYRDALRRVDFIKRFVFPGSFIPCVSELTAAASRVSDLRLTHLEDIGPSYARTLAEWRRRFERQCAAVRKLGYPMAFIRLWRYYLCYCEAGFRERSIGDAQFLFARRGNRRPQLLGDLTDSEEPGNG